MNEKSIAYVKGRFAYYYSSHDIELPPRFTKREWAFFYWDGEGMHRPVAFKKSADVRAFFSKMAPRHAYFSSAYYMNPEAPMEDKVWLGADLVFDIDADHVPGCQGLRYEDMLRSVKNEIKRLVFDFLMSDFGFDEKHVEVFFSGGRGYHAHVRDPRVLGLGSAERREIVDYITGRGLNYDTIFPRTHIGVRSAKYGRFVDKREMPEDSGGWYSRMREGVIKEVERLAEMKKEDVIREFMDVAGIGEKTALNLYSALFKEKDGLRGADRIVRENVIDIFPNDRLLNRFLDYIREKVKGKIAGETDEPVTSDIKRLIRAPGSLHGKTSLCVRRVDLENFDDFDPLMDAVVFGDKNVEITFTQDLDIEIRGEKFSFKNGETCDVPEYVAMFALCRGVAEIK
ncbi:MAG: DNA primase catalytic subunit PriS [Thermoplasmata archaeon]|nr:MAG: DNA primase catalytic subunit PriS [Thermoplasmata archaeon]